MQSLAGLTATYQAPPRDGWRGRDDGQGAERFWQHIVCHDVTAIPQAKNSPEFVLLGFACDMGVLRNAGRVGAQFGPQAVRQALANLTISAATPSLTDAGDIVMAQQSLAILQTHYAALLRQLRQQHYTVIGIGGGHEISWAHYQGLTDVQANLGIINLDAHFDCRPVLADGEGTSGSSFAQIQAHCQRHDYPFGYLAVGTQTLANTTSGVAFMQDKQAEYILAETIHQYGVARIAPILQQFIAQYDAIYLTLCLDVLSNAYAPGVSAPQPLGLTPWQVLELLTLIVGSGKVTSFDIAEYAPCYDVQQQTGRLAAHFIAHYLRLHEANLCQR